ncbi:hypothetical protein NDU88_000986 [Pleurodeles waltl]|uniref:Uncharacterized protein n=1 Tax=Pleurodeles waltl TaxID=8319 RepID=A0AAV7P5P7_PLEWA|nr:hypothetical protein NDU88_000986 [Pleurodeles waltl]
MAEGPSRREELCRTLFADNDDINRSECLTTKSCEISHNMLLKELEQAKRTEVNKWWEKTTLRQYIDCGRVARGMRIFVLPTLNDMDADLLKQWQMDTVECSVKLMQTLIIQAERKLEKTLQRIKEIEGQLESTLSSEDLKDLLSQMEKQLEKHEKKIQEKTLKKFNRDEIDYYVRRTYTFASHFISFYAKQHMDKTIEKEKTMSSAERSEMSSGDELPITRGPMLDFSATKHTSQTESPHSDWTEQDTDAGCDEYFLDLGYDDNMDEVLGMEDSNKSMKKQIKDPLGLSLFTRVRLDSRTVQNGGQWATLQSI